MKIWEKALTDKYSLWHCFHRCCQHGLPCRFQHEAMGGTFWLDGVLHQNRWEQRSADRHSHVRHDAVLGQADARFSSGENPRLRFLVWHHTWCEPFLSSVHEPRWSAMKTVEAFAGLGLFSSGRTQLLVCRTQNLLFALSSLQWCLERVNKSLVSLQLYYAGRTSSPVYSLAFDSSHLYVALDKGINMLDFTLKWTLLSLVSADVISCRQDGNILKTQK